MGLGMSGHLDRHSGLYYAMCIIIESGAIYSVAVAALFGTYVAQNDACYAISDAVSIFLTVFHGNRRLNL